jgi:LPXTG-site transpeptidase (sortase) family protein
MRLLSFFAGLALVIAGLLLVAYGLFDGSKAEAPEVSALPLPALEAPAGSPPQLEPSPAPVARLDLPSLNVSAPVVSLGVLDGGLMESPRTPTDVGWYSFSARPGTTGNAVFAGHVDYANYGPAVFYHLRDLKSGDLIRVALEDGTTIAYQVTSTQIYEADSAPVQEIVGPTPNQTITLITCTGVFDRNALDYDKRLVVKGERSSLALAQ